MVQSNYMKKFFIIFIFIYFVFSVHAEAVELGTTGFISGSIWYSKDTLVEGDTVKVYTALWNNSTSPLSAKVEFYDKNVILGTRDIVVPSLKLEETYISWKVTAGDHSISAKIISPSITSGGKKQVVMIDNSTSSVSKTYVPVVINTIEGKPATSSDILKNQIDKATSSLDGILPESISEPVTENVGVVDSFRVDTLKKISETKAETKNEIDAIKKAEEKASIPVTNSKNTNEKTVATKGSVGVEEATEKPIAYLKLIFLSILSFVFGSKIIFYLIIAFILYLILRTVYRKIRNR